MMRTGSRRDHRAAAPLTIAALAAAALCAWPAAAGAFTARGSAEQVDVTGVTPGAGVSLVNAHGARVDSINAGPLGGAIFRNVKPGAGYKVRADGSKSHALTVMTDRPAPPSTKVYDQKLPTSGYGYLSTRDGTKLALDIHLPAGKGPFPTLVEYAGYGYADPKGPDSGIAPIANLLGFAVVDVNMRGTGCSGGAYDYFEPLQGLDGYDVIETVARQPWVLHHKVGLMGVSYGGISQLFVAETRPPSLAAITPLSVIDDSTTTLYAGGILNTGFTVPWVKDRVNDAKPATTTTGQTWAYHQITSGDATCKANQDLHPEAVNLLKKVQSNRYYVPKVADPLSPITFVDKIDVPVFMACQFTDEQTGGHCPDIAEHFTGTKHKWFTFTNGVHTDSLDPATFQRWYDFLELYVAKRRPRLPAATLSLAPTIYQSVLGIPGVMLPVDAIQSQSSYSGALQAFQALPSVRILFDNGAGTPTPGVPLPGFERSFKKWPLPGTVARSWYLGPDGTLTDAKLRNGGSDHFTWNPKALPEQDFSGDTGGGAGGLWNATPAYHWLPNPAKTAISYLTAPLTNDTTVVGGGAVQAWITAGTPDVDLQVTISEVRPDGMETFVQDGWLRASDRALSKKRSTLLEPILSLTQADASPLPKGKFTLVTIPMYYEGHAYRKGSRIRITIAAPNGAQPIWAFSQTVPASGKTTVSVAFGGGKPSRLVLPVVPSITVPTPLPPCPGLRGEPCRPYVPLINLGD